MMFDIIILQIFIAKKTNSIYGNNLTEIELL